MSLIAAPTPIWLGRSRTRGTSALSLRHVMSLRWPWLGLIAVCQVLLAKLVTKVPTAFQDEGLYIFMGHRVLANVLHGDRLTEFPGSYFSGAPAFYPVLAAWADSLGGLELVRDLSLVVVIATTVAVQGIGESLFGRLAGLLGAAAFALCGSVVYLSQWATFDALAMMLAAFAAWLAVSSAKRDGLIYAPVVGLLLFLCVFAKYAGAMYVPVVAALAVAVGWRRWGVRIVSRAVFMMATAVVLFFFVVLLFGRGLLPGLAQTTTERQVLSPSAPDELLVEVLLWVGPWLALAALAALLRGRSDLVLVLVLLGGSVIGPAQQIHIGEATSLRKHVAFGLVFACALVGDLLARMVRTKVLVPLVVVLAAALGLHGHYYAGQFLTSYPDDTALQNVLRPAEAANDGRPVLGEQSSSQRYELRDIIAASQWHDTYVFNYAGKSGGAAYEQAVADHYFGVIYLNFTTPRSHDVVAALDAVPLDQRYYHLVAQVPGSIHGKQVGEWLVWAPQDTKYTVIR